MFKMAKRYQAITSLQNGGHRQLLENNIKFLAEAGVRVEPNIVYVRNYREAEEALAKTKERGLKALIFGGSEFEDGISTFGVFKKAHSEGGIPILNTRRDLASKSTIGEVAGLDDDLIQAAKEGWLHYIPRTSLSLEPELIEGILSKHSLKNQLSRLFSALYHGATRYLPFIGRNSKSSQTQYSSDVAA